METDQRKLLLAVAFLVLALGVLGFQVFGRIDRDARGEVAAGDPGVMMEPVPASAADVAVAWVVPSDYAATLETNPFLRPPGSASRAPVPRGSGTASSRTVSKFRVTGIRTGSIPTVIVNDRTRREGDEIAGWRIVSIERDRVTLRSSDGRTIRLDAR